MVGFSKIVPFNFFQFQVPDSNKPCCQKNGESTEVLKALEVVCRLALAIFSAIMNAPLFVMSTTVGLSGGACYAVYLAIKHDSVNGGVNSKPVCAQGFMETLSGLKFHPVVNQVVTAVFIGAHIRHDPSFYVPFCGLFIGTWVGYQIVSFSWNLSSRVFKHVNLVLHKT